MMVGAARDWSCSLWRPGWRLLPLLEVALQGAALLPSSTTAPLSHPGPGLCQTALQSAWVSFQHLLLKPLGATWGQAARGSIRGRGVRWWPRSWQSARPVLVT